MILASKILPKNGTKWKRFLNLVNRKKVFHRKSHPQHLVPQECGLHEKKCGKLNPDALGSLTGKCISLWEELSQKLKKGAYPTWIPQNTWKHRMPTK